MICCDFNSETFSCEGSNYISVYYGENVSYDSNFIKNRENINFMLYENKTLKGNENLAIKEGSKLEIYFNKGLTSLKNFFSKETDDNVVNIVSIDFSHFNSSGIEDMSSLFNGCNSLTYINFSKSNTQSLTNMGRMFSNCGSLKGLDLSMFDTSLVVDMTELFYGCNSLEILNIANFDMIKCDSFDNMFPNNMAIKFINIFNLQNDKIVAQTFNKIDNFFICQKEKVITNPKAFNCCDYLLEDNNCTIPTEIIESTLLNEGELDFSTTIIYTSKTVETSENTQIESSFIYEGDNFSDDKTESTSLIFQSTREQILTLSTEIRNKENTNIPSSETAYNMEQPTNADEKEPTVEPSETEKIKQTTNIPTIHKVEITTNVINIATNEEQKTSIITKTETQTSHLTEQDYTSFSSPQVISTALQTTIPTIATTFALIESNSIVNDTVKITEENNPIGQEPIIFLLLGYSHFTKKPSYFSFYTYLLPFERKFYPKFYRYVLILIYPSLRQLQTEVQRWENCTLVGIEKDIKLKYLCKVEAEIDETTKIKIDPNFQFEPGMNITISHSTISLAYMDNIQNVPEEFDALLNSTIYILLHSKIYGKNLKVLNISGVIEGPQPNFQKNMSLSLIVTQDTNRTELVCTILDITRNKYTLNCKTDKDLEGAIFQNSISFFEKDSILVVNFDNLSDSKIEVDTNNTYIDRKFYNRKNSGMSTGAIVAIVLSFVSVILVTIIFICYLRKKKTHK